MESPVAEGGQQQPTSPKSSLKSGFLHEAEGLLLEVDETLEDLLEYIGLYLLFMFVAMVMSRVFMLYFFVDSFVKEEEPQWHHLLTSVVYSVIYVYLNTTADHFNYQVTC